MMIRRLICMILAYFFHFVYKMGMIWFGITLFVGWFIVPQKSVAHPSLYILGFIAPLLVLGGVILSRKISRYLAGHPNP